MALPATLNVSLDFSTGATFGIPFTLDDAKNGILGTNVLADEASYIVDLTDQTMRIAIRRGRNVLRDTYEAGYTTVRINDPDSYFSPQNTSSPYYGKLQPLRKLRISATVSSTNYFLFSGYVTEYRYTYPTNTETGFVDITAYDAFRLFQLANVTTVTGQSAGQDTGTRIAKILDTVSFPTSMRTLDTGNSNTIADPATSRASLQALKNCETSEQGAFYINPSGTAVFKNRTNTISSAAGTPIVFNQTTGIPYADLKFAFDDKLIINSASVTRSGGTAQTASDATSIAQYFPHSITFTDLVIDTDANALNIAKIYVATRQATTIRIDEMTLDLLNPSVTTATVLGIDYFQPVTITNVQPDGSTIVKNLQIQGIAHDITPNSWRTVFTTLERITDGFIVGSSTYGVLGQDIIAY
jgi:hypothetical protein